jgi:uncharacterized protein YfaS (alpha-2-macroglobulin family)
MQTIKLIISLTALLLFYSCTSKEPKSGSSAASDKTLSAYADIPLDKGFSKYITSFTSGVVPVNSSFEIRFSPEFASEINKKKPSGLFTFDPSVNGKTEWIDDQTIVFTPGKILEYGKTYSGSLNLYKLADVEDRLKTFPFRIQTRKKDFQVIIGALTCATAAEDMYNLSGELVTSDFITSPEVEDLVGATLGKKKIKAEWLHKEQNIHIFTFTGIERTSKSQDLKITWDGTEAGIRQKGSTVVEIPPADVFSVIDMTYSPGESQKIEIIFSDPVSIYQETEGLIWLSPASGLTTQINSNIVTLFPVSRLTGVSEINVESSVKNTRGKTLSSSYSNKINFSPIPPAIALSGNGIIIPPSGDLIFPFRAVNLKAVDLKIIKIFDNNLPYFLQDHNINTGYNIKRFGRPVYSGKVDLVSGEGSLAGLWNLYKIDLSEYINVEPGILYKVEIGMRPSYSLFPCAGTTKASKYEELLIQSEEYAKEFWDDPEVYYETNEDALYYSAGFRWEDRDDPCKDAYFSPDRRVTRNFIASNLGIIAKKGDDDHLHVLVHNLLTAMPVNEADVDVFDYQMQLIISGKTGQNGSADLTVDRKPFLVIVRKDTDRNYLKTNDGSSLSLSSFDVSGDKPEKGIKAFIYGERDVWRPGDSIYLSLFIIDTKTELPADHPVRFELLNPLEQNIDNQVQKTGKKSLLVFKTSTPADALTGNYKAIIKIGGATFTKKIRIETIKANRLKIDFKFPYSILGGSNRSARGTFNVKWLNGNIAKNLDASVEYILKHTTTEFEKYRQYVFDDPVNQYFSETVKIFDGKIDENGNAVVNFAPSGEINAPGMLNALFTSKVREPGGDESIVQTSYRYAPYNIFAGIYLPQLTGKNRMIFTDRDNEVKVVSVDENGKPVTSDIEISLYKLSYRWWWESDQENLAYFITNNIYKPVLRKTITTTAGEGSFSFKIDKKEWGRYLIRATTPAGHSTGKIILIDWPWEYGMKGNTEGATLLAINSDKEKYKPGDEIKISFPAPENARAIVTLENQSGIFDEIFVSTKGANTVVNFKAIPKMTPNVYACVTVIQPHSQTVNDMPIRLYGVIPIMVEDPETRLSPVINMPAEIRSQQAVEIKISESGRKNMNYTLAVVDEGLLDITGFKTPDPWNYFYSREALGVQTWDLYDFVLGAFGGTLERIFAIGGDEAVIDRSANKAQRFIPVVKFLGPFTLQAGRTNTHTLKLPQYTGSVRTMVIAGNEQRAFGIAEKSVLVKDPVMVLLSAPRVLSPGEKVSLPVTTFIQEENINYLTLNAESNEIVTFDVKQKNISVFERGEKVTEFNFSVGEATGVAELNITVSGGGEKVSQQVEIDVRNPNPPETRNDLKIISKGDRWETTFSPFGIKSESSAVIEISNLPSANLEGRLDYLITYPHGCTEQLISAAFPQLYLNKIRSDDPKIIETAAGNIQSAINMLVSRQMGNGGIALWPGSYQPDNWVTSYAGHFCAEAEKLGYNIPSGFKQKWTDYQKRTAQEWRYNLRFRQSANDQAYRLFTLALAGQPERGLMNRLREAEKIPVLSGWLLAAAFATSGRPEVADDLIDVRNTLTEEEYRNNYYGSELRDKAVILYTLTILKKEEQSLELLKDICLHLNNDSWYNTQSVAWALFSYMKYTEILPPGKSSPSKVSISLNGEKSEQTIQSSRLWSEKLKIKDGDNVLSVENMSDHAIYANLVRKGIPLQTDITREEKGLSMKIDYLNMDLRPVDQKILDQGTDFMMVVRVANNTFNKVENIALSQMVPSGWEIQNTRMFEADYGIKESGYDYRDFRDDRVYTYFSLNRGETKTFVIILNASYKGEFYQPSIWCEAMYVNDCYSRIPGNIVKVTGQKLD